MTLDVAIDASDLCFRFDQLIAQPLVVPFHMIVLKEFVHRVVSENWIALSHSHLAQVWYTEFRSSRVATVSSFWEPHTVWYGSPSSMTAVSCESAEYFDHTPWRRPF